jgi:hypothetical protein
MPSANAGKEGPNSISVYRSNAQETPAVEAFTMLLGVAAPASVNSLESSIPSPTTLASGVKIGPGEQTVFFSWARRILPAKNSLNIADVRHLENAFQTRLAELELGVGNTEPPPSPFGSIRNNETSVERKGPKSTRTSAIERIEKSGPAHPEPRRVRDREHVKFVAGHPFLVCGRQPADLTTSDLHKAEHSDEG